MKTEFMLYQTLADSIKAFEERKDRKGKDTFDLSVGGNQTLQHYQDLLTCSVQC